MPFAITPESDLGRLLITIFCVQPRIGGCGQVLALKILNGLSSTNTHAVDNIPSPLIFSKNTSVKTIFTLFHANFEGERYNRNGVIASKIIISLYLKT